MDDAQLTTTAPPAMAVVDWLLSGASEAQVAEALAQRYPGCDPSRTLLEVQQHLIAAGNPNADAVNGWALLAYRKLFQQMLAVGDLDGARKVVKEIQVLGGGK